MVSGFGLMLLGAWGAIIPFVGPYFDYAYTPKHTWMWTAGRGYLEVLPGAVAFLAGLGLLVTRHRATGSMFGWFGVLAGAWFVVGPLIAPTWDRGVVGTPVGGVRMIAVEQIGIFYGLGAAIVLFAATAVGRFSLATPMSEPVVQPAVAPAPVYDAPVTYPPPPEQSGVAADDAREPSYPKRTSWLARHRHHAGAH